MVDIVIPVYNEEKYLSRCLDSIKAQTYPDWRAICVDDGSIDGSSRILDAYAASDPRFVVIHTGNGGVSRARNIGLSVTDVEYVMFIDSDDLIHPQTLELAVALAERDGSDIVTWYRDRYYRTQVAISRFFGLDDIRQKPWSYNRKYSLSKVKSIVTDNLLAHCTDLSDTKIEWPVKHFYIWKYLFRRNIVEDIRFIEGMNFEDFPWWSEVIMKDLKTTITYLPLYYRYPNGESIVRSSKEEDKIIYFLRGIEHTAQLYSAKASPAKTELWNYNCKWSVIVSRIASNLGKIRDERKNKLIRRELRHLLSKGTFDDFKNRRQLKARLAIEKFIAME